MGKKAEKRKQQQRRMSQRQQRRVAVASGARNPSQPRVFEEWRSRQLPAGKLQLLEDVDNFSPLRNGLREIARKTDQWAGIPMPQEGLPLIIEPRYPHADVLMQIGRPKHEPTEDDIDTDKITIRNRFWSFSRRQWVVVYEIDGRVRYACQGGPNQMSQLISTLGASDAWGVEQESRAVQTLAGLVSHRTFKQYMLTGMFLEQSKRSKVMYLFRRLRPTIAITLNGKRSGGEETEMLAALCLHPIAYYEGSWAGAMTPTDDVIAHLSLMRGDEHGYWKKANQHPAWNPNAGVIS